MSPAMQFIGYAWSNANTGMPWSWTRLNYSMRQAVIVACHAGMKFEIGDFELLAGKYKLHIWGGNDGHMWGEPLYSEAVKSGNLSACKSFERLKKRAPFFFQGNRIAVGSQLRWNDIGLAVTSFTGDGKHVVCCSHKSLERRQAEAVAAGLTDKEYNGDKLAVERVVRLTSEEMAVESERWCLEQKLGRAHVDIYRMHGAWMGSDDPSVKRYFELRRQVGKTPEMKEMLSILKQIKAKKEGPDESS